MWRGAMIGLHAECEGLVVDFFEDCRAEGYELPHNCFHESASKRAEALSAWLESGVFEGHGKATLKWLSRLRSLSEERNALAHGGWTMNDMSVVFTHFEYRRTECTTRSVQINLFEMPERISEMAQLRNNLKSQLGQIIRLLRESIP